MLTKWVKSKNDNKIIYIILILLIISHILVYVLMKYDTKDNYTKMVEASNLMKASMEYIYKIKSEKFKINHSDYDINKTGLIGNEFSSITTTLGDLEAKRTSTNPDFAALMIDYFVNELKLNYDSEIAVGASGSFPALLLAVQSAAEVLNLNLTIIYSLGSSNYGSNIVGFTMADIVPELNKQNLIKSEIKALSIGGLNDIGENMSIDKDEIINIYKDKTEEFIFESDLEQNINKRIDLYNKNSHKPDLFINIGGNQINYGRSYLDSGLILNSIKENNFESLIEYYLQNNIPVINLLNIKGIANEKGLEIDPKPLPESGESELYYNSNYSRIVSIISVIIVSLLLLRLSLYNGVKRK